MPDLEFTKSLVRSRMTHLRSYLGRTPEPVVDLALLRHLVYRVTSALYAVHRIGHLAKGGGDVDAAALRAHYKRTSEAHAASCAINRMTTVSPAAPSFDRSGAVVLAQNLLFVLSAYYDVDPATVCEGDPADTAAAALAAVYEAESQRPDGWPAHTYVSTTDTRLTLPIPRPAGPPLTRNDYDHAFTPLSGPDEDPPVSTSPVNGTPPDAGIGASRHIIPR